MNTSRRTILKYGAAFSATAFMPGNKLFAQTGPVKGGVLVIAQYPEPSILTAALGGGGATNNISPKIFDGLLTYDNALKPVPQLAESWEVSEDGLTITFRLRSNAKWRSGRSSTAAASRFSPT
jgi:peptide/nickel transport system substrate-binding protein